MNELNTCNPPFYGTFITISIVIFVLKTHFGMFVGVIVPALRGKDYGKTRMRFPDYTETPSGLQYKVTIEQPLSIFFVYQLVQYTLVLVNLF